MKKFLLLSLLLFVVVVVLLRQRLFLRDPLGGVVRDGVKELGAQVFINYPNDVLVENDNAPAYVLVIQHGQHVGTPAEIKCMHWMMCLTDANQASLVETLDGEVNEMSGKRVVFTDAKGHVIQVTLR